MRQKDIMISIDQKQSEYIRGIAIVFVVLGHILGGFKVLDANITNILGIGGVTMFLFLSGYGLYRSYQKNGLQFKAYWDKKIEKVFLPYAVITVVYYLYMKLIGTAPGFPALLSNILCVDYTRKIDGTMWYMSFLLLWYIAFFFVFYFKTPMVWRVGLLALLGCAFYRYWLKDTFASCAWQFSVNAFSFPIGVGFGYFADLVNRTQMFGKWKPHILRICWFVALGASVAVLVLTVFQILAIPYWVCGIAIFAVLYALFSLPKGELIVFKWLGANSFLIYLTEQKLIEIWMKLGIVETNIAIYLISYAAAIVAIVYLYRFGCFLWGRVQGYLEIRPSDGKNQ